MSRTVIAIDGLAGSGKTTISRLLAERLGFIHLNTGLLYRGVAFLALNSGTNVDDAQALAKLLSKSSLALRESETGNSAVLIVNGRDVTSLVQSPEVSEATSKAARHPEVRNALRAHQRDAFPNRPLVAEGRDMGTVVFPDAQVKFFIEADAEVRVARRLDQLAGSDAASREALKAQMLKEIVERDERDAGREVSPTKAAHDAIHIDNSLLPLEEVIGMMERVVLEKVVL